LLTEAADPSLVEDPALIIYNAMRDVDDCVVVTNGSQTDTICEGLKQGESFYFIARKSMNRMHRILHPVFPE